MLELSLTKIKEVYLLSLHAECQLFKFATKEYKSRLQLLFLQRFRKRYQLSNKLQFWIFHKRKELPRQALQRLQQYLRLLQLQSSIFSLYHFSIFKTKEANKELEQLQLLQYGQMDLLDQFLIHMSLKEQLRQLLQ